MNPGRAFTAGVIGAVAMSLIMLGIRMSGVPLHVETSLAGVFGIHSAVAGLVLYLAAGGLFGVLYASVFELVLHQSGVLPGLLLGACNTIFAGFFWSLVGGPGQFWEHFGASGIGALILVHFVFGAVVGSLYRTRHVLEYW